MERKDVSPFLSTSNMTFCACQCLCTVYLLESGEITV